MFQYLKGGYKEEGNSLFATSHVKKTKGNGCNLLLGRVGHKKKIFTLRTTSHWNNFSKEAVVSPTFS